jgi:DNA repair exonuclease SbcCD ATPase subunit
VVFRKVTITNFQSLKDAELDLGLFTVVTGPTGSGKSGLVRALRLVCFNRRGSEFVRRGAKTCMVQLGVMELEEKDGWAVGIERAASGTAHDAYVLALPGGGEPVVYTKLGGSIPEPVAGALRVSPLNFAGQHDPVFLLAESGADVARRLGELTNVTLVFEAAREANRRRQALAADLKRAEASLARLAEQARAYRHLKEQKEAIAQAGEHLTAAMEAEARIGALRARTEQLSLAQRHVLAAAAVLARHEVPSLEALEAVTARAGRLRNLASLHVAALMDAEKEKSRADQAALMEQQLRGQLRQVLLDAGYCPVCGQAVSKSAQPEWQERGDGD